MKNNIFILNKKILTDINYRDFLNGKLDDGVFSLQKKINNNKILIARDKYGAKKIFYCSEKKKIHVSDNFIDLKKKTQSKNIFSLAPGHLLIFDKKKNKKILKKIHFKKKIKKISLKLFEKRIIDFLKLLKKKYGEKCIILLSGGLDSTIIAYLAKKVFKKPIAVTAVLLENKEFNRFKNNKRIQYSNHTDFSTAERISKKLNLSFQPIISNKNSLKNNLKKVMYYIQDWRDFNVHCGCLNFEIAKYLKKNKLNNIPILTGDFMNEIFADYTSEIINKKEYYKQLKGSIHVRSKWLTQGLETSDRENGIFNKFNLPIYQPYFRVIDLFENVDKNFFKKFNKYTFNGKILPKEILKLVSKKKNRAQITDKEGGILGFFIKSNITDVRLFNLFKKSFKFSSLWLKQFIVFGKYKVEEINI